MTSPKIYIALGISGQTQHTIGCGDAKTIIAVNRDDHAAIWNQADTGLVGDVSNADEVLNARLG